MNLSFSPTVCPEALLSDALEMAKNAGFGKIELFRAWTESSPIHPDTSVRMVRECLQAAGVTLTGRKADSDERNLPYNLGQVEWDIHLARALGLKTANLKGGARTQEAQEDLIEGVNQLLERVPDVTLNLENHMGSRLQDLADYQTVMPHLDGRVRILLDTGHLLSAGGDILQFAETFADRIGLVHLRDQQGDQPVPFGEGDLPFEGLIRTLRGAEYDGTLVVELEGVTWADPAEAARTQREYVETILAA